MSQSYSQSDNTRSILLDQRKHALRTLKIGAVLLGVGLVITIGTFAMAKPGGTFIVSYGPVIFGLVRMVKGWTALSAAERSLARLAPETDFSQAYQVDTQSTKTTNWGFQSAAFEPTPSVPQSGSWFPDPSNRHELRYWDGSAWTPHVSNQGVTAYDPA